MAKKKQKQPYIPFYTGDYIKDTRALSLEAKGAWMDLILFMWVNGSGGILEGTMEDFARMVGTSEVKFVAVLNELCRKDICDIYGDQTKIFKIACRRLVREAEISAIRSEAVQTRYKTSTNDPTKTIQKTDNDIDNGNESDFKYELKESAKKSETFTVDVPQGTNDTPETLMDCELWTSQVIDGNDADFEAMARSIKFNSRLEELARSHLALCSRYAWHETIKTQQAFRNSLLDHVRKELKKNGPERTTKTATTGNRNTDHIAGLAADHARRYGADGTGNKG